MLGAASEASVLGPQLTVMLACADVSGLTQTWQQLVCLATVVAFVASVIACALNAPRRTGSALPPTMAELVIYLLVDVLATVVLTMSFPQLWSTWLWWALLLFVIGLLSCASISYVRQPVLELIEPIMPMKASPDKVRPGAGRDVARGIMRALVVVCAVMVLGRASQNQAALRTAKEVAAMADSESYMDPEMEQYYENFPHHAFDHEDYMGDRPDGEMSEYGHYGVQRDDWSEDPWLLLRWLPTNDSIDDMKLLAVAANMLGVDVAELALREMKIEHRLMIFEFAGEIDATVAAAHLRWQEAVASSPHPANTSLLVEGASLVDISFPAYLNTTVCNSLGVDSEDVDSDQHTTSAPGGEAGLAAEVNNTALEVSLGSFADAGAQQAYISACTSWRRQFHYYDDHDYMDHYDDMHGYDDEYPYESYSEGDHLPNTDMEEPPDIGDI